MTDRAPLSPLQRIRAALPPFALPEEPRSPLPVYASVILAYVVLAWLTRPVLFGDSYWYIADIQGALAGDPGASARLWEFGHLIWRPLGVAAARLFLPIVRSVTAADSRLVIAFLLVAVNVVAAVVCALNVARLALRFTGRRLAALAAAFFFLSTNAVLNYSRGGTPYLPGLACVTISLALMAGPGARRIHSAVAGLLAGAAVLFWLPYIFLLPAICLAPFIAGERGSQPGVAFRRSVIPCAGAAVLLVGLAYAFALRQNHIGTWSELSRWVSNASHGLAPQQRLARMVAGVPRSFISVGEEGILLKRFFFKDPYANVTLAEIIRVCLVKIVAVWGALAVLAASLWASPGCRRILVWLVVAIAPNVGMALGFESGAPERYLPFFPFLFIAAAVVFRANRLGRVVAAACCVMAAGNAVSLSSPVVNRLQAREAARIACLSAAAPGDLVYVLNIQDPLLASRYGSPFGPDTSRLPEISLVLPFAGKEAQRWQARFAGDVLGGWSKGRRVWITGRVLAARPPREWNWVEGDDGHARWHDVHQAFEKLRLLPGTGNADGFLLLPDDDHNRAVLSGYVPPPSP